MGLKLEEIKNLIKTSIPDASIFYLSSMVYSSPFGCIFFLCFSAATLLPLLVFCFLRLFMVGQFGVVSFMGVSLAGHATHYLDEDNIELLSGETRTLANEILQRKRKLSHPCNMAPFSISPVPGQSRFITEQHCWGIDFLNTAWLVAIKQKMDVEPWDQNINYYQ